VEYRFPIAEPVGGVLFADFASDLGSGDTVLGSPAVVRDKPGTGFGYGFGLRVLSPLGLIRGDLGISDRGDIRFELTTGQRF
jgi:outer membrane protein insertion porin family